jgi:3-hydroxybutyryl-CoA dehydratase
MGIATRSTVVKPSRGQTLGPLRIPSVSAAQMKEWAEVLRDPNPIHLDPEAVKAKGLGDRVINQGPANLSYIIAMLQTVLPQARICSLDVRYLDNVFAGDAVEAGATIVAVGADDPTRITCEVWLNVETRGAAIQGSAVLNLPS